MTRPILFKSLFEPTIVSFLDDPEMLGKSFRGETWDLWRAVLRAAFCLPMTTRDLELFGEVSGGRQPPKRRVKELVICAGRGAGKDSIAALIAVYISVTADSSRLRPGEKGSIITMATDRDQAGIAFGYIKAGIEESPLLAPLLVKGSPAGRIRLRTGAEILVETCNVRSPRGKTVAAAIFDEAAHWRGEDFAEPDTEVDTAVTPGLLRFPGSLKIIISSVHRRSGLLYDKYSKHFGQDDDDVLVVLGSSIQFNPTLDQAEIDRQLLLDPERAGAEYLSRWRDDLSSFLDRQLVESAVEKGISVRLPESSIRYSMFADPSGGRGDSFTAAIGHREGPIAVIDALYERRAPFDSEVAVSEVAELAHRYNVSVVRGDDYGADLTVAMFRRHRISYQSLKIGDAEGKQGRLSRSEIYLNSVSIFTSARVKLLDNQRLVHQLISLERRAARGSGHDTVDHPPGAHDDIANAVCGCLVALQAQSAPLIVSPATRAKIMAAGQTTRDRFGRSAARFAGGSR